MSDDGANKPDRQMDRRAFFRRGLREFLAPLADALEQKIEDVRRSVSLPVMPTFLRPPGALDEAAFLDACSRCGVCVSACPAHAIKLDPDRKRAGGAPYIVAEAMPCVVCSTLECMTVCPSGALVPTPIAKIDIGTAVWTESSCKRTTGEPCTICVDECPVGEVAIRLAEGKVQVIEEGCIGCGVCEYRCPTSPRSVKVVPKRFAGTRPSA
jgi:ferredoxin-type protein NapG